MREKKEDPDSLKKYLEWLKAIFKDKAYIALAYMTGILPIKIVWKPKCIEYVQ